MQRPSQVRKQISPDQLKAFDDLVKNGVSPKESAFIALFMFFTVHARRGFEVATIAAVWGVPLGF